MLHVVSSTSSAARLDAAIRFLTARPPADQAVIVGASRGAADDLARTIAARSRVTFGLSRFSFTEFAARTAAAALAGPRRTPSTRTAAEAVGARAVFDAIAHDELAYFAPVATMPGFARALARSVYELRLAAVTPDRLIAGDAASADIGRLLARAERLFELAGADDRAALFRRATAALRGPRYAWAGMPMVLLDVPLDTAVERQFVAELASTTGELLATVPAGDQATLDALAALGGTHDVLADSAAPASDLASLRRYVFTSERPPARERAGDVSLFSAPGEGREAVEIVRRVLDEAARGVRFDDMAVFLRAPQPYLGLLEHACARGGVPVSFDRGVRRPDPAGRAFIALLSCAVEGLSARRFDEYLSLGQVPRLAGSAETAPGDEVFGLLAQERGESESSESSENVAVDDRIDSDDEAVVAGTLRSPWKWEELIVESAVVGGRTRAEGSARWRRRLDGLAGEYALRMAALKQDEPESPRIARFERDLRNLRHLREFALPVIDTLAAWPDRASWGEWLDRFGSLASRTLVRPARALAALADLRPMAEVGPVTIEEARNVLHDRLVTLDWDPPPHRYGRLFVGTPHQARGRSFRVVFVPGLAERVVPQRPREDPLLLDDRRRALGSSLVGQDERSSAERLLLRISIGAATERLYLSYPRLDVAETRARVPSFYALDVMRAVTGRIPDHRVLASDAAEEAGASLAWPAPRDPDRAIDDLEHDLASFKPLLEARDAASVKGHARYLLELNGALARSVRGRWARSRPAWSPRDGLVRVTPAIEPALGRQRLGARPYSLSALQRFSICPYQFLLATIYRLEPWEEPEPLVRMDPLTRGSLFHKVQAEFFRAMQAQGALPVASARLQEASRTMDTVLERVAREYEERLAPAIDRVWRDEIGELRRDLGIWVQTLAADTAWQPEYFEFSFGLRDEGRDPHSLPDPVRVDGRFVLRGSVDLIERRRGLDVLRVTDHKTGRDRSTRDLVVGGGATLQPVLYSLAVQEGLGKRVASGRLFYCTTAGGYASREIPIDDHARAQGLQVLEIIDRAVEDGFLPAAPAARACTWCDFRPVCGPGEEARVSRKAQDRLADLTALRSMR